MLQFGLCKAFPRIVCREGFRTAIHSPSAPSLVNAVLGFFALFESQLGFKNAIESVMGFVFRTPLFHYSD
jgi:hypothetical protein